jgi:hypothetical protein
MGKTSVYFFFVVFWHNAELTIVGIDYYYGDTFFSSAGTNISPFLIQTILGAVSVAGTIPALYIIESWGRRQSLLIGALLQAACALVAGLVGHFTLAPTGTPTALLTTRNKQGGDTLIAFAILHVFAFNLSWGPTYAFFPLRQEFRLMVTLQPLGLFGWIVPSSCQAQEYRYRECDKWVPCPLRYVRKLISVIDWIWNFLLSFFAPKIANQIGELLYSSIQWNYNWRVCFQARLFSWSSSLCSWSDGSMCSSLSLRRKGLASKKFVACVFCNELLSLFLCVQVDELYRAKVKPWRSSGWKPHLYDARNQLRKREVSDLDVKEKSESPSEEAWL